MRHRLSPAAPSDRDCPRRSVRPSPYRPDLDFVGIARGLGVPAEQATTAEEFTQLLGRALAEPGPYLIDCLVPPVF
ncbi:thiamine pyrophosphate-dependent enzyme [Streptomyces sp. R21]|uniref:Thiamine pyrophosphate-dependent enzyme n=1 Tax=Streptomyces sp. R21 TaxID=3238627 RepID=A0AB39P286_9ACTN